MCFYVGFSVHLSNLKHLAMGSHFLKLSYFASLRLKYELGELKKVEDYVLDLGVGVTDFGHSPFFSPPLFCCCIVFDNKLGVGGL